MHFGSSNTQPTTPKNELGPYEPNGAIRMPMASQFRAIALRRRTEAMRARSGRESTKLVGSTRGKSMPGTARYANTALGDS